MKNSEQPTLEEHNMNEAAGTTVIRSLSSLEELDLFLNLSYVLDDELADDLSEGRRAAVQSGWVATSGSRLLARAAWWGQPGAQVPGLLDFFDVDDTLDQAEAVEIGTRLLRTAMAETLAAGVTPPEYGRFIPPDWRDDAASRRVVETRMTVLENLGGVSLWRKSDSVPSIHADGRPGDTAPQGRRRP